MIACEGGYYFGRRGKGQAVDLEGKVIRKFKGGDIVPLHVQNFIDAVRGRDASLLNAPLEMGNGAPQYRLGKLGQHCVSYWKNIQPGATRCRQFTRSVASIDRRYGTTDEPLWHQDKAIGFPSGSDSRPKN